jgi:hypothetical protein
MLDGLVAMLFSLVGWICCFCWQALLYNLSGFPGNKGWQCCLCWLVMCADYAN